MSRSNTSNESDFMWWLGMGFLGFVGYRIFKKDDEIYAEKRIEPKIRESANQQVYSHTKLKQIIMDKTFKIYEKGNTTLKVNFEINTYKDKNGYFRVHLRKFHIISQISLNGNLGVFQHISQFQKYYKFDKSYTYNDYDPAFNTREGTTYHERLHQEEIDIVLNEFKPYIEDTINKIYSTKKK